ncbi:MAG: hypothetical protein LPH19_11400, partial [Shewanella sp.]|nr:hypothetical protein [Shewanella sp.]
KATTNAARRARLYALYSLLQGICLGPLGGTLAGAELIRDLKKQKNPGQRVRGKDAIKFQK